MSVRRLVYLSGSGRHVMLTRNSLQSHQHGSSPAASTCSSVLRGKSLTMTGRTEETLICEATKSGPHTDLGANEHQRHISGAANLCAEFVAFETQVGFAPSCRKASTFSDQCNYASDANEG